MYIKLNNKRNRYLLSRLRAGCLDLAIETGKVTRIDPLCRSENEKMTIMHDVYSDDVCSSANLSSDISRTYISRTCFTDVYSADVYSVDVYTADVYTADVCMYVYV